MVPNRILRESILTSRDINRLTPEEEVLWYRLLVCCDDYGFMDADPAILRARAYPRRIDSVTDEMVTTWLRRLVDLGMVVVFASAGAFYLRLPSWERHQQVRAKRRKYPELTEDCAILQADEITRKHLQTDDGNSPRNPIRNPIRIQSESNPRTTPASRLEGFDTFWKSYPRRVAKGKAEKAWEKLNPGEQLRAEILLGIERAKTSPSWLNEGGKYIPHPATWLNAKGWLDEISPKGATTNDRVPVNGYSKPEDL